MKSNISSKEIDNPLLIGLLRQLHQTFLRIGDEFFIIGATARDFVLRILANSEPRRKTRDLDIAIAVNDWERYNEIGNALVEDGFEKDTRNASHSGYGRCC